MHAIDYTKDYLTPGQQEFEQDGFTVKVRALLDEDPMLDWMGHYATEPADKYSIERKPTRNNDYPYYIPTPGGVPAAEYVKDYYDPLEPLKHILRDFERLEDYYDWGWCMLIIEATAYKNGIALGRAVIGGVESDATDYLQEIIDDQAWEAVNQAKDNLASLCEAA